MTDTEPDTANLTQEGATESNTDSEHNLSVSYSEVSSLSPLSDDAEVLSPSTPDRTG